MDKKIIIFTLIGIIVLGGIAFFSFRNNSEPPTENKIILFYRENCPFCANVDAFIKDNKIEEKVSFEKKEVFNNQDNAKELVDLSQRCGLPSDQVGVPFLWDGSECLVGDTDIINFFQQKINEK